MRITCGSCRADFVLSDSQIDARGVRLSCPFCRAAFQLTPEGETGNYRVFFSGEKAATRICVNCGAEFGAQETDTVPVCPDCKSGSKKRIALDQGPGVWKVFKEGRQFDLESEAAVREWIREGLVLPDDVIVVPGGRSVTASRVGQFREAFRIQRQKRSQPQAPASAGRFSRFRFRPAVAIELAVALLFSAALGWTLYRVARYRPTGASQGAGLPALVEELKRQVSPASRAPASLIGSARALLLQDRPETYETARRFLQQALVADPDDPESAALLSLAYAFTSEFGDDPRLRLSALEVAQLAIRSAPGRVEGYAAKARAALYADNAELAAQTARHAAAEFPDDPLASLTLAEVALRQAGTREEWNRVIALATEALRNNPQWLRGYDLAGVAHIRRGEPDQAKLLFEQRLQRAPDDPLALYRLGTLEERAENLDAAAEWYQRALRGSPNLVEARLALAVLYSRRGEREAAERHLRDILTRYRRFSRTGELFAAQTKLAGILLATKRASEARDLTERFPPVLAATPEFTLAKASVLEARGQNAEAISVVSDASEAHPSHGGLKFALAQLQEKYGTMNESLRTYRSALEADPLFLPPYLFLARLLIQKNSEQEALDVANAAVTRAGLVPVGDRWEERPLADELLPWSSFERRFGLLAANHENAAVAHALLGLTRLAEGVLTRNRDRISSSVRPFERAFALARTEEYAGLYLGRAHFRLQNWRAASDAFHAALRANPSSAMAHYWMGAAKRRLGRFAEAERQLNAALTDPGWSFRALYELGEIALARRDSAGAIALWRRSLEAESRYLPPWKSLLQTGAH